MSGKKKMVLAVIILLVILISAGYLWFQRTNNLLIEAQEVIESGKRYDLLKKSVDNEFSRCQEFITQKEGDFGSFEYCKKFIDWVNQTEFR